MNVTVCVMIVGIKEECWKVIPTIKLQLLNAVRIDVVEVGSGIARKPAAAGTF